MPLEHHALRIKQQQILTKSQLAGFVEPRSLTRRCNMQNTQLCAPQPMHSIQPGLEHWWLITTSNHDHFVVPVICVLKDGFDTTRQRLLIPPRVNDDRYTWRCLMQVGHSRHQRPLNTLHLCRHSKSLQVSLNNTRGLNLAGRGPQPVTKGCFTLHQQLGNMLDYL
ncbi:hypothetical protein D3C77_462060 [compost metagenome]